MVHNFLYILRLLAKVLHPSKILILLLFLTKILTFKNSFRQSDILKLLRVLSFTDNLITEGFFFPLELS